MFPLSKRGVGFLLLASTLALAAQAADGVKLIPGDESVRIEIQGELFTEYRFRGAPHVFLYPVIGPDGIPMTRNAPMKEVENEDRDHPHHRSLWFSHGDVNGIDFWAETPRSGKIIHDRFLEIASGTRQGVLRAAHRWVAPDGTLVCTDETTIRVHNRTDARIIDFEITLRATPDKAMVLGDTKEGSMGIRLAETMRLKPNKFNVGKPTGHIVLSTGVKDNDTWGKRAAWCDYYGPVNGKIVGVALFDHPQNPKHPTWWHVRDYGLFAANPFGVHDFEKKPAGTGNVTVDAGKSIQFKYRFYIHRGTDLEADVAGEYRRYTADH